jgi:hypothetical protein
MIKISLLCPLILLSSLWPHRSPQNKNKLVPSEIIDAFANFDWDGDGKPDQFTLHVEKQFDYSIESEKTSKEKFLWYHCWLSVRGSHSGKEIWRDEWSVKEDDMPSFKDMANFSMNREFFVQWFKIRNAFEPGKTVNTFELLKLTKDDIDADVVAGEITRLKIPGISASRLNELIVSDAKSRSFCYRASWREDLRCAIYVPQLQRALLYQNGYR